MEKPNPCRNDGKHPLKDPTEIDFPKKSSDAPWLNLLREVVNELDQVRYLDLEELEIA